MPGIIFRYIFRQAAGIIAMMMTSLTGVVWIALALKQLSLVTSQGQDSVTLFKMTLLALPNLMAMVAPVALLVAAVHTLNRLNGDSELIVMTAGGANLWTIAKPLVTLAVLVALAISMVNHFVMPWSLRQLRTYIVQVRTDLISQVLQPGTFATPEQQLTLHIRERARNGNLLGLVMEDERDQNMSSTYLAESGEIVKQDGATFLLMHHGNIMRQPRDGKPLQMIEFDSYAVDLAHFEAKDTAFDFKPRERYFNELVHPDKDDVLAKRQSGLLRAELHERFSNPLYPIAFALIAVAFIGHAQTTRQNRVHAILAAFILSIGGRLGGMAGTNLVALSASAVWMVYTIPIALGLFGVLLIASRRTLRPPSRARRQLQTAWAHLIETVVGLVRTVIARGKQGPGSGPVEHHS
ncbi:MAG: LPS export ABC transporter permease LptF [Hyphomicrobiaceae bacterium]